MDDEKFCLWAIGIAIILFASILGMTKYDEWKADNDDDDRDEVILIQEGDEVSVDYTGYFQGAQGEFGAVFDTSRRDIAENESIPKSLGFMDQGAYDDLTFTVVSPESGEIGQMIKGFNDAVLGKKVGQAFVVSIPSHDAYGPAPEELRYHLNITQTIPVYQTLTMDEFQRHFGDVDDPLGKTLSHPFWSWDVTVMEADPTEVTIMNQPIFEDTYNPFIWNTTVEDISTERNIITLQHHTGDITSETTVPSMTLSQFDLEWFDNAVATSQWDEMGSGSVTVSGGMITIDFNKEVAGKTLIFEIKINKINRGE